MGIKSQNKISLQGGMSSMTDLVFLLLIFFIILSTLANTDQIKVDLPSTGTKNPSSVKPQLTITIDDSEQFYLNKQPLAWEDLEETMLGQIESGDNEQNVVIMVDQTVPTQLTVQTLALIKKHNWKVVLATQKGDI